MIEYGIFHGIRGTKIDTNLLARFFVALFHCSIVPLFMIWDVGYQTTEISTSQSAIRLGICASKKSSAGCYFVNFLICSSISQVRMSCWWFHSSINTVSQEVGGSGLVANYLNHHSPPDIQPGLRKSAEPVNSMLN